MRVAWVSESFQLRVRALKSFTVFFFFQLALVVGPEIPGLGVVRREFDVLASASILSFTKMDYLPDFNIWVV